VDPLPDSVGEITLVKTFTSGAFTDGESDIFQATFPFSPGQPVPAPPQINPLGYTAYGISTAAAPSCPVPGYGTDSAGNLKLSVPGGSFLIAPVSENGKLSYEQTLPTGTLQPGAYIVSTVGGADVGPFESSIQIGAPIQVTGSYPPGTGISSRGSFTVMWSGGDGDELVRITLISHLFQLDSLLTTTVPATAHSFTFTGAVNNFLPIQTSDNAELVFEVLPKLPATFSAKGLTLGGYFNWEYKYRFTGLKIG
jgi:hypothetical protein